MIELNVKELLEITKGKLYGSIDNYSFNKASTDTRKIEEGDLFFAFKGETFNGNKYTHTALINGAKVCIVDEIHFNESDIPENKTIILVEDVTKAIGIIAKYYLKKVDVKVIGVTGSCGKTSTKDLIAASLSKRYKVLKTLGNYNNGLGLPLTILRLDHSYDVAVLEMGMSNAGEIEYLANIANPHMCAITNIGLSHIENLGSQENILKAKLECTACFGKDNILVVNGNDEMLNSVRTDSYQIIKIGTKEGLDIVAKDIKLNPSSSDFNIAGEDIDCSSHIDIPGEHNIINYLLAVAIAKNLGLSIEEIEDGLKNLEKTSMRLDVVEANGITIINDCYNASVDSMKAALDVQCNLHKTRNVAVLGPMYELGEMSLECHSDVGKYALDKNIDMVFTTGEFTSEYKKVLNEKCMTFENKSLLTENLKKYLKDGDCVLIKASRGAKFEEIYNELI